MRRVVHLICLLTCCLAAGCSGTKTWNHEPRPGKTAEIRGQYAVAPKNLPPRVKAALHAGNLLVGQPYKYGGGHRGFVDCGYDCSGAVSYVLRWAGLLSQPGTSSSLRSYGSPGRGKYITVYAGKGHVFIEVAGLRFDTGYHSGNGPRWTTRSRPIRGYVARHPPGL